MRKVLALLMMAAAVIAWGCNGQSVLPHGLAAVNYSIQVAGGGSVAYRFSLAEQPMGGETSGTCSACVVAVNSGTTMSLTPVPDAGYRFKRWIPPEGETECGDTPNEISQNGLRFRVFNNGPRSCTAEFEVDGIPEYLTMNVEGGGIVTTTPSAFGNCSASCLGEYPPGTTVSIEAKPADGWTFSQWSGDCASFSSSNGTLLLDRAKTCGAKFVSSPFTVRLTARVIGGSEAPIEPPKVTRNVPFFIVADVTSSETSAYTFTWDFNADIVGVPVLDESHTTPNAQWYRVSSQFTYTFAVTVRDEHDHEVRTTLEVVAEPPPVAGVFNVSVRALGSTPVTPGPSRFKALGDSGDEIDVFLASHQNAVTRYAWRFYREGDSPNPNATVDCAQGEFTCQEFSTEMGTLNDGIHPSFDFTSGAWRVDVRVTDNSSPQVTVSSAPLRFEITN